MASSNRHWPSMFKSKPTCNPHHHHHQWQQPHDSNSLLSSACHRSPGCEERSPEPKPRWNPKPEQIRILESIFNSGMVNPPREEIRKIRAQLQEYGQVGDANVFYWFQNRKSRSKHKNRNLQKTQNHQSPHPAATRPTTTSSSSSSDKSSSSKSIEFLLNSPTASVNQQPQAYFSGGGGNSSNHQLHGDFLQEPFFFPVVQTPPPPPPPTTASFTQGFCFPELNTVINQDNHHGNDDPTLFTDLMMMNHQIPFKNNSKGVDDDKMMKMLNYTATTPPPPPLTTIVPPTTTTTTTVPSTITDVQGVEEHGPMKSTVFINDVAFEVGAGQFNLREAFGDDAVLIHSSGQPVATNEWGVTLQSLEHGSFYYLVRSFTYDHVSTIDLL